MTTASSTLSTLMLCNTALSCAIATAAEDRPVQRTVTEKRLVQIDFSRLNTRALRRQPG